MVQHIHQRDSTRADNLKDLSTAYNAFLKRLTSGGYPTRLFCIVIQDWCNEEKSGGEEEDCSNFESTDKNGTPSASMKD